MREARLNIDAQLTAAGWVVQSLDALNLAAAQGVAVRKLRSQGSPADFILFVDGKALGVVEAKEEGSTLSTVADHSGRYSHAHEWTSLGGSTAIHLRAPRATIPCGTKTCSNLY